MHLPARIRDAPSNYFDVGVARGRRHGDALSYGLASPATPAMSRSKGAKPAELPLKRPTKFDLDANLKRQDDWRRNPQSIMLRADEVMK